MSPTRRRAGPLVIARLRRNDELVAVGAQVLGEDPPEVALRGAIRRAVVVRQVEVGDAEVEGAAQDRAAVRERPVVAEVLPQPERDRGELQPRRSDSPVWHRLVAAGGRAVQPVRARRVKWHGASIAAPRRRQPRGSGAGRKGAGAGTGPHLARARRAGWRRAGTGRARCRRIRRPRRVRRRRRPPSIASTAASTAGVETSKLSRRLSWEALISSPIADRSPARSAATAARHARSRRARGRALRRSGSGRRSTSSLRRERERGDAQQPAGLAHSSRRSL